MRYLKFRISGDFAYFKNPEHKKKSNSFLCIHKPAILGLLGAICGYKGFHDIRTLGYIEYLEKLKGIKLSITIENKIQPYIENVIVNTGQNNMISDHNRIDNRIESVLSDVSYEIILQIKDDKLFQDIFYRLNERKYVYTPFLGKTTFVANIDNIEEAIETNDISNLKSFYEDEEDGLFIESIFPLKDVVPGFEDYDLDEFKEFEIGEDFMLPVTSSSKTGIYSEYTHFTYNRFIDIENTKNYISVNNKLRFFL